VASACEKAMAELAPLAVAAAAAAAASAAGDAPAGAAKPSLLAAQRRTQDCCRRMDAIVRVLGQLIDVPLPSSATMALGAQMGALQAAYKLLAALAKQHTPPRGRTATLSVEFRALVDAVHTALTPQMYALLSQATGGELQAGRSARALAARLRKEARAVPDLVYVVEAWERQLLLLGKARRPRRTSFLRTLPRPLLLARAARSLARARPVKP